MDQSMIQSAIRCEKYKDLLELGSIAEANIVNDGAVKTLTVIETIVTKSDELNVELQHPPVNTEVNTSEVVMDAQVIKMSHELLGCVVQTMDNADISDDEYLAAINRLIGPNKDWEKLTEIGMKIAKSFYYSQSLFGTFDEETVLPEKEVKLRQKSKSKNAKQMKPVVVGQQQKEDQAAGEANLVMNQLLKLHEQNQCEPVPYYKVIIDPTNFMKTVQNAFQISFLFRDGVIVIGKDKFGYPTIRPTSKSDNMTFDESTQQMVSTLSAKYCDEMIQHYNITEACLSLNDS